MNPETAPLLSAYTEIVEALIYLDREKYVELLPKVERVLHALSRYEHGLQIKRSNPESDVSSLLVDVMMGDHK
jgi:hypothetical protein